MLLKRDRTCCLAFATVLWLILASSIGREVIAQDFVPKPNLPMTLPNQEDGTIFIPTETGLRATHLLPELQDRLTAYLVERHSPVAAVVVLDAKTGHVLAMAQGQHPGKWGGKTHTALHSGFPAASLFKSVVTSAAFELADIDARESIGLYGGCQNVRPSGVWMKNQVSGRRNKMTLRRAYGQSCNSFYAKIAINHLGLGIITDFAARFGWQKVLPADFYLESSPFRPPTPENSSTHTVGRYAAGFGYVGINAFHAAWMMLAIANEGREMPMSLFTDSPPMNIEALPRIFSQRTATRLIDVLDATVRGGTASFAFRRGKYRKLRQIVGGKTGTLTGHSPQGLTTWFAGMMPLDDPEIVVAAVVVLEDLWHIKGPHLAAEAFWTYYDLTRNRRIHATAKRPGAGRQRQFN